MIARLALLIVLVSACDSGRDTHSHSGELASTPGDGSQQVITVELLANGEYSLDGTPVSPRMLPAAYSNLVRQFSRLEGPANSRTRVRVPEPTSTTWDILEPVIYAFCEDYGEALYLQGERVRFQGCLDCAVAERFKDFSPIEVTSMMSPDAVRAALEPAAGGIVELSCQPKCPLSALILLIQVLNEADVAYVFSGEPARSEAPVSIAPFAGEEEPPEMDVQK